MEPVADSGDGTTISVMRIREILKDLGEDIEGPPTKIDDTEIEIPIITVTWTPTRASTW